MVYSIRKFYLIMSIFFSDVLKLVKVIMSVTVLSRVVTGFINTVTAMSRVISLAVTGRHGKSISY